MSQVNPIPKRPVKRDIDEIDPPDPLATPVGKKYKELVTKIVLKSKVRLSMSQVKVKLGERFDERFNLITVLESIDEIEGQGVGLTTWGAREPVKELKSYSPSESLHSLFARCREHDKTYPLENI